MLSCRRSHVLRSLLLAVVLVLGSSFGLQQQRIRSQQKPQMNSIFGDDNYGRKQQEIKKIKKHHGRQSFLQGALLATGVLLYPQNALALKPKDEVLCGTGFFTNIAQWKCTEIGDILDEGKPKEFSQNELGSMESLLGKLDVSLPIDEDQKRKDDTGKADLGSEKQ